MTHLTTKVTYTPYAMMDAFYRPSYEWKRPGGLLDISNACISECFRTLDKMKESLCISTTEMQNAELIPVVQRWNSEIIPLSTSADASAPPCDARIYERYKQQVMQVVRRWEFMLSLKIFPA